METRFWELLTGFFSSPVLAKNQIEGFRTVSETQWEGFFESIWKATVLAEGFLGRKLENPVKGVLAEKGVIEVSAGWVGSFKVYVEPGVAGDSTEQIMVALARSGLGVKRLNHPGKTEDERRDQLDVGVTYRAPCHHNRTAGWDRSVPCPHCVKEAMRQTGVEGVRDFEREAGAPADVLGIECPASSADFARFAKDTPSEPAPTPVKDEVCEQHPAGPHEYFLKSACPWCQGCGDYFEPAPAPLDPVKWVELPLDRAGACGELFQRALQKRSTAMAAYGAICVDQFRNSLYEAWSAGYAVAKGRAPVGSVKVDQRSGEAAATERRATDQVLSPPKCTRCGDTEIIYVTVGDGARIKKRCPECWPGATPFQAPNFTELMSYTPPAPEPTEIPAEPPPPSPPSVETQIQGAVAEASSDLFKWLEPRMRPNSDKSEERTRVFTTLAKLAEQVVGLCRAP